MTCTSEKLVVALRDAGGRHLGGALPDREPGRAKPLQPESQTTILACLAGKQLTYNELKQACLDAGQKEGTFRFAFRDLNRSGQIMKWTNAGNSPHTRMRS